MRKLEVMTEPERTFAEKQSSLIFLFLRRNRLPESDYYDVAVFGYLEAVQQLFSNLSDDKKKNFSALANICMKSAEVCVKGKTKSRYREL